LLLVLPNDEAQTPRWVRSNSETFPNPLRATEVVCSAWFGRLSFMAAFESPLPCLYDCMRNAAGNHEITNEVSQIEIAKVPSTAGTGSKT